MDWLSKIPNWIKIPIKVLLPALAIFSGFIVLASDGVLEYLNLLEFEQQNGAAFAIIFLVCVSLIICYMAFYDSDTVERPFAEALDNDPDVKLFFKIPKTFKISTPLSNYSPDWAVYVATENEKKLYFVIETKGNENINKLRPDERLKIHCGEEHFKALASGIEYNVTKDWQALKRRKV